MSVFVCLILGAIVDTKGFVDIFGAEEELVLRVYYLFVCMFGKSNADIFRFSCLLQEEAG